MPHIIGSICLIHLEPDMRVGFESVKSAQAAIMRAGLNEMRSLAERMYPTVRDLTFFESCGVADLIATCYGVFFPNQALVAV